MRQFKPFLAMLLPTVMPAFAYDVRISTFDTQSSSPQSHDHQMNPETAELILARRLGRPESERVGHADESVVQDLNSLGGEQPDLFGATSADKINKMFLVLEAVDDVDASTLRDSSSNDILISEAPRDLLPSLDTLHNVAPEGGLDSRLCSYEWDAKDGLEGVLLFRASNGVGCPAKKDLFYNAESKYFEDTLSDLMSRGSLPTSQKQMPLQVNVRSESKVFQDKVKEIFSTLRTLASDYHLESTAVLLPKGYHGETQKGKRSNNAPRDVDPDRQPTQISTSKQSSPPASSDDDTLKASSPRESEKLSHLMPVCHASNTSCNDATQNCSGHGYCYRKNAAKSSADADDCYACKCTQTVVRTNDDGSVKRTQWGGPACQKKDVSMPFWLIGGLSVLLVFVIGSAIGMMFNMGQEELPSVLSSGVTAPKKG